MSVSADKNKTRRPKSGRPELTLEEKMSLIQMPAGPLDAGMAFSIINEKIQEQKLRANLMLKIIDFQKTCKHEHWNQIGKDRYCEECRLDLTAAELKKEQADMFRKKRQEAKEAAKAAQAKAQAKEAKNAAENKLKQAEEALILAKKQADEAIREIKALGDNVL